MPIPKTAIEYFKSERAKHTKPYQKFYDEAIAALEQVNSFQNGNSCGVEGGTFQNGNDHSKEEHIECEASAPEVRHGEWLRQNTKVICDYVFHTCDECQKKMDIEYDWQSKNEHYGEDTIICPYCDYEYENYDACQYEDNESEIECPLCGKKFDLEVRTITEYSTKRSLCEMPEDYQGNNE